MRFNAIATRVLNNKKTDDFCFKEKYTTVKKLHKIQALL